MAPSQSGLLRRRAQGHRHRDRRRSRFDWTGWLELAKETIDEVISYRPRRCSSMSTRTYRASSRSRTCPSRVTLQPGSPRRSLRARRADRRERHSGYRRRDHGATTSRSSRCTATSTSRIRERQANTLQPRLCQYLSGCPTRKVRPPEPLQESIGRWGPKRKRQAEGLRKIVNDLVDAGEKNLIVMGDLNEGPDGQGNPSQNFAPLYAPDSPLVDVFSPRWPGVEAGPSRVARRRTGSTTSSSARTWRRRSWSGGVERHGLWGAPTNKNPPSAWEIYPTITRSSQAASDHAAIFVDLNI